jgi:hypothetical protein
MNTILVQSPSSVSMAGGKLCFTTFTNNTEGKLRANIKKSKKVCRQKMSAQKSQESNI